MEITNQQIKSLQEKIRSDSCWFAEQLGPPLWEKEKEILRAVDQNREVAIRSCNASGKTFTAARVVHSFLMAYSDAVVITTAPTGRQVREVLWREIKQACQGKDLYPPEAMLETKINIDDRWFALGIATDEPDQFQGFHSPHLLVIVDESSGVKDDIFEAIDGLKPTRLLMIGNPLRNVGRFARAFKEQGVRKLSISAFDTPNIEASPFKTLEDFREKWEAEDYSYFQKITEQNKDVIPGLINISDVIGFAKRYGIDSDVFRVRVLGEFPRSEEDSFLSIDEISGAMQREVKVMPEWEKVMGVDVARFGGDRTSILVRQMGKIPRKQVFSNQGLMATVGEVIKIAKEENVKPQNILVDAIGIGAGVVDRLREQGWNVQEVNVGSRADDPEHFFNLRAELYFKMRDWIRLSSIPEDDDFYEAANIKYQFTSKGQLKIEGKDKMKGRGLPSPDVIDSLALTFASKLGKAYVNPGAFGGVNWDRY